MEFDFDEEIERRGTLSTKWDNGDPAGTIELWIADMDFRVAPVITRALERRVALGPLGYGTEAGFREAVAEWFGRRHNAPVSPSHVLPVTGAVPALTAVLQALCQPGDEVIVMTPAYNCFFTCLANAGVTTKASPLILDDGAWKIDFGGLRSLAARPKARALLLCNPHNPTGRVWTRAELQEIAAVCAERDLLLISDEVHAEFASGGHVYTPAFAVTGRAVTISAASKAFNTAGLQGGYVIIPDDRARRAVDRRINISETCEPNIMAVDALVAAYSDEGAAWLDALNRYLDGNWALMEEFAAKNLPGCFLSPREGSYLAWIDLSPLCPDSDEAEKELLAFRVRVNGGKMYAETGPGWVRINLATTQARFAEGLRRIGLWAAEKSRAAGL